MRIFYSTVRALSPLRPGVPACRPDTHVPHTKHELNQHSSRWRESALTCFPGWEAKAVRCARLCITRCCGWSALVDTALIAAPQPGGRWVPPTAFERSLCHDGEAGSGVRGRATQRRTMLAWCRSRLTSHSFGLHARSGVFHPTRGVHAS